MQRNQMKLKMMKRGSVTNNNYKTKSQMIFLVFKNIWEILFVPNSGFLSIAQVAAHQTTSVGSSLCHAPVPRPIRRVQMLQIDFHYFARVTRITDAVIFRLKGRVS